MKQRYSYRIYPHPHQKAALARLFGCCRLVYNDALAYKIKLWKEKKESISNYNLQKLLTKDKKTKERSFLNDVCSTPLKQSLNDLDQAFKNFFSSLKGKRKGAKVGYPKFKKLSPIHISEPTRPY